MTIHGLLSIIAGLLLAPLLQGIVNRTKAVFAGRRGAPLLQQYRDIARLLRKGAVFSGTTTWIFRLAPSITLACVLVALVVLAPAPVEQGWGFAGDALLLAYALGLARFLTVAAALDTGSSFEGMGASREVFYSALAEPALLVGIAVLARVSGGTSLASILQGAGVAGWVSAGTALALVGVSFFVVLLAENSRVPFDDPNTHLELTMVHEVMVLDSSGPDFALVTYGASLKLWVFSVLFASLAVSPLGLSGFALLGALTAAVLFTGVIVGTVESTMARSSLVRAPLLLAGACALSILAFILASRFLS